MNVTITRTKNSTTFAALLAGATYVAADDNGKQFVYTKLGTKDYDLPVLLGKNRRGNPVGAAVRSDGRLVFHFLDKKVVAAKANAVSYDGVVNFKA